MTRVGFTHFWAFALVPLVLATLLGTVQRSSRVSSLQATPSDPASAVVQALVKAAGAVALSGSIFGAAGPFLAGEEVERVATGAAIVMLIDRSGSMNETFAGKNPGGGDESKATASRRILKKFVDARRHDLVGVVAFSTAPMLVTPLSDHPDATKAAIDAMDRPGLDYTNIARGLSMALAMFRASEPDRARAIMLISDGAGVIDPRIQDDLRAEFKKAGVDLYWLFLRTEGSQGLSGGPGSEGESPQAQPERHLDVFFKSLGVPYRAFEAEGPEATEEALRQIDGLERRPMRYVERLPRRELGSIFFAVALGAVVLMLLGKLAEVRLARPGARS
jgi:mxaC protein